MDLYEVESKIKELEASYNKEADNLMQELNISIHTMNSARRSNAGAQRIMSRMLLS